MQTLYAEPPGSCPCPRVQSGPILLSETGSVGVDIQRLLDERKLGLLQEMNDV